ncbi:hypothetical protein ACS0TY_030711 [Phlomoides rotata]
MPAGYQSLKLQQFDGKENPKQHVTYFLKRATTLDYGDHLSNSIDSWNHMKQEFMNSFYSNRRTINMIELTNTHQ